MGYWLDMERARRAESSLKYICFLLFLPLLVVARSKGEGRSSEETGCAHRRCAAHKLLWRWLEVGRQIDERADDVMHAISMIQERDHELERTLQMKLEKAKQIMVTWSGTGVGGVALAEKRLLELGQRRHENRERRQKKCEAAKKNATLSKEHNWNVYFAVRSSAQFLTKQHGTNKSLTYEDVSADLVAMGITNHTCNDDGLVSKTLEELPARLQHNTNLCTWKNKTKQVLDRAAQAVMTWHAHCGKQIDNLEEKAKDIREAIDSTVRQLTVAMDEYTMLEREMNETHLKTIHESEELGAAEARLITLGNERLEKLCAAVDSIQRRRAELRDAEAEVAQQNKTGNQLQKRTTELLLRAGERDQTASLVAARFSTLEGTLAAVLGETVPVYERVSAASSTANTFSEAAALFVKGGKSAQEQQRSAANTLNMTRQLLEKAQATLKKWEHNSSIRLDTLAKDACPPKMSSVTASSFPSAIRTDFAVTQESLLAANKYNKTLSGDLEAIEVNLKVLKKQNEDVDGQLKIAEGLDAATVAETENTVARVTNRVKEAMCSSARAITELREQHHHLRTSTTSLQHDVSMASTSATTAWATAQTLSQLPSVLNNSLAEATATVKVLGHQLTGIVEKSDEVVQALETAVTNADKFRPSSSSVLGNLVRAIDLNLNYTSFKPDCSVATDITVVRKLATSKSDLFKYVSELDSSENW
ncbi:hypothetical protein TRVL_09818 [Trypanosoma vivax]|nr:hypothetical protein TRVL_09818 [Trypanosoma vivax]